MQAIGTNDCGMFAIATATALAVGLRYSKAVCENILENVLRKDQLHHFSIVNIQYRYQVHVDHNTHYNTCYNV